MRQILTSNLLCTLSGFINVNRTVKAMFFCSNTYETIYNSVFLLEFKLPYTDKR